LVRVTEFYRSIWEGRLHAYFTALRRYFSFSGRSSRKEIWGFTIVSLLIIFVALVIEIAVEDAPAGAEHDPGILFISAALFHLPPSVAVLARRLHDQGDSAWRLLLAFVPGIGGILWLIYASFPPTAGPNKYGPPVHARVENGGKAKQSVVTTQPTDSTLDLQKLEKLASLQTSGAIDEKEFQSLKAAIIGEGA
jgi:uncharacterized membrane protein YhaH (DUF805 family)